MLCGTLKYDPMQSLSGVDLRQATKALQGLVVPALDVDWLALDSLGSVAVFLGAEGMPPPQRTNAEKTSLALETITRGVARRVAVASYDQAYRVAASRAQEPIFDLPLVTPQRALHEKPFEGYPHLVVTTSAEGAATARRVMTEVGGREVLARDAFAVVVDVVGHITYEELHREAGGGPACAGCRVLDDPRDPRPRSPEAIASAGLYVFGYPQPDEAIGGRWRAGAWIRIASPSVPADRDDLQDMAHLATSFHQLDIRFEDTLWLEG